MQSNKNKIIGLVVIVLLAVAATGGIVALNKQDEEQPTSTASNNTSTSTSDTGQSTASSATTGTYKNGTYTATGSYQTPQNEEEINVTLTVTDNIVSDVVVTGTGRGDSAEYQTMFKEGVGQVTEGKNINEIRLSRVSGSSLTSTGFNAALETIKNEAKA